MLQQFEKIALVILFWLIVAAGMTLRIHNGDYFPIYQNDDSLFYVWLGNSIWDDFSRPTTLTIFEADNPTLFWRSQYKDLVPAERFGYRLSDKSFDHPFLAAMFNALPSRFFGFTGFIQIPQMLVRTPAFFASLLSLILTYILAKELYSQKLGLLALTFLAFWPMAIFSQRQAYLENMITPALLLAILSIYKMKQQATFRKFIVLSVACTFAAWSKFAGYVLFGISAYFLKLFSHDVWSKRILWVGLGSLCLYLAYGQLVGGEHFWWNISQQGGRGSYLTSIFTFFSSPQVQGSIEDGWWYLGLFGMIYLATKKKVNDQLIGLSALAWFFVAFFLSGPNNTSPWYIYPTYPLLMIGAAVMIFRGESNFPITTEILLIILGLTGWRLGGLEIPSLYLRVALLIWIAVIGLILYIPKVFKPALSHRIIISCLLLLALTGNVWAVRHIPERVCGIGGCTQPTKIILPN